MIAGCCGVAVAQTKIWQLRALGIGAFSIRSMAVSAPEIRVIDDLGLPLGEEKIR
jgi:hypothetical protein